MAIENTMLSACVPLSQSKESIPGTSTVPEKVLLRSATLRIVSPVPKAPEVTSINTLVSPSANSVTTLPVSPAAVFTAVPTGKSAAESPGPNTIEDTTICVEKSTSVWPSHVPREAYSSTPPAESYVQFTLVAIGHFLQSTGLDYS